MRDELDAFTLDLPLPRYRGRPPESGPRLTRAEKMVLYRERRRNSAAAAEWASLVAVGDGELIERLRQCVCVPDIPKALYIRATYLAAELARRYPLK